MPIPQSQTPRKLGRIGGRCPSATQEVSQAIPMTGTQTESSGLPRVVEQEESQSQYSSTQIGASAKADSERPRTPTPEVAVLEESQEEKVVRKRRELDREMSQVKTTPKKKRRF